MTRDPIEIADEWVEAALLGKPWEARDSNGQEPCFIERGTGAAGDGERFIEAELSYLDACIVERLLEVARTLSGPKEEQ